VFVATVLVFFQKSKIVMGREVENGGVVSIFLIAVKKTNVYCYEGS
jgi:hypothetical protein